MWPKLFTKRGQTCHDGSCEVTITATTEVDTRVHLISMTTQIEEFEARLNRHGETDGCRHQKVDFHIHMPGSSDYEYGGDDALDLMARQITDSGLALATIVKHQEFPTKEQLSA